MLCLVAPADTTKWVWGAKRRKHFEARRVGVRGTFSGSFVTFCVTFWGFVLKLLLKLSRFCRGNEAVFLCKRAQRE